MRLIAVLGGQCVLRPTLVPMAAVAEWLSSELGFRCVSPQASWISKRCGRYSHDFLYEEDSTNRIQVFSEFIRATIDARAIALVFPSAFRAGSGTIVPEVEGVLVGLVGLLKPEELEFSLVGTDENLNRDNINLPCFTKVRWQIRRPPIDGVLGICVAKNMEIKKVQSRLRKIFKEKGVHAEQLDEFLLGLAEKMIAIGLPGTSELGGSDLWDLAKMAMVMGRSTALNSR